MKHRLLGGSGLRVSEMCLGTMTFGEKKEWGTDPAEAAKIIATFTDAGGSFIDTAPNYADGAAEQIVGKAIKANRDEFVIGTKFTASSSAHPLAGGNSRRAMVGSIEASLKRLDTDRIDMLWLHFWDGTSPMSEILKAVDDCVRAGKVLYFGMSNTPAWLVSRAVTLAQCQGWTAPSAIQVEYNVASRDAERELLPMAEALDLGVLCWGPLAAGALAGGENPLRRGKAKVPAAIASVREQLAGLAQRCGLPAHALALAWLMRAAPATIPVLGARTAQQLAALITVPDLPISADLLEEITRLAPVRKGYPHDMIGSPYLRRYALGDPEAVILPERPRA